MKGSQRASLWAKAIRLAMILAWLPAAGCGAPTGEAEPAPGGAGTSPVPAARPRAPLTPDQERLYQRSVELGRAYLGSGRYTDAALELSKAAGLRPEDPNLLRLLGNAHAHNNDLERARRVLEASARLAPNVAGTHYELAMVALAMGDLPLARMQAERTVGLDPHSSQAHELLGTVQYRQGQLEPALQTMKRVVGRDPARAEAHYISGLVHQHQERFEEARDSFRLAVQNDPNHAQAYFNLGKMHGILGEHEDAERANAEFLRLSQGAGGGGATGGPPGVTN